MNQPGKQKGMVLVLSLLMIAVLAVLATASLSLGQGSQMIVLNQNAQMTAAEQADVVIENTLSNLQNFTLPADYGPAAANQVETSRSAPVCVGSAPVSGFSLNSPIALQHNYYQFDVTATDQIDGGVSDLRVGVRILLNAGTCT